MRHGGALVSVTFDREGRRVISAASDGTVRVWEAGTGVETSRLTPGAAVTTLALSPSGSRLALGDVDGIVQEWEIASQESAKMEHAGAVSAVIFSPDGRWLATTSWDGTARVWARATGQEVSRVQHAGRARTSSSAQMDATWPRVPWKGACRCGTPGRSLAGHRRPRPR